MMVNLILIIERLRSCPCLKDLDHPLSSARNRDAVNEIVWISDTLTSCGSVTVNVWCRWYFIKPDSYATDDSTSLDVIASLTDSMDKWYFQQHHWSLTKSPRP